MRHHRTLSLAAASLALALAPSAREPAASAPGGAEALPPASFDCRKAAGVDERLICSDPVLRGLDSALARDYKALLESASDRARRVALRGDEHNWILRRNYECGVSKSLTIVDEERPGYADCFAAAYDERLGDLARMRAEPSVDPTAISSPVRRSLFHAEEPVEPLAGERVVSTGLSVGPSAPAPLAYRPDGALLVFGTRTGERAPALYAWSEGKSAVVPGGGLEAPAADARLCVLPEALALVPRAPDAPVWIGDKRGSRSVARDALAPELGRACGIDPERRLVGAGLVDRALDLGLARPASVASQSRYLRLVDASGERDTEPPVRLDRRYALVGAYDAYARAFVVQTGVLPEAVQEAALRRWAKSNCERYWLVDAQSGRASTACVPYGTYALAAQTVLPAKPGTFLAGALGLYRVAQDSARRVLASPVRVPVVAPDGCSIAFAADSPDGARARPVSVARLCPP